MKETIEASLLFTRKVGEQKLGWRWERKPMHKALNVRAYMKVRIMETEHFIDENISPPTPSSFCRSLRDVNYII
nr:7382_t:CDS:2 [Entrophospora candida]